MWKRFIVTTIALCAMLQVGVSTVRAQPQVLGVHILHPYELQDAKSLLQAAAPEDAEAWYYVTIPFSHEDLKRRDEWENFFRNAKAMKVIPLVRLTTRFENGAWTVPNRKEITDQIAFLKSLEWPTEKKHIIVFNEMNHAKEWGGRIDPVEYAQILHFTSRWAHSEEANFVVLPGAMDLAAPNGRVTMEAFTYLEAMLASDPEVFAHVDAWNSHAYPNPGFSASPEGTAQNSLRGFLHELEWLKEKTGRDYRVYITETGWVANGQTNRWLEQYYTYALEHVWSHPQVEAVTPFVLRGDPGPFGAFSFIDRNNKPTPQYAALQKALARVKRDS